MIEGNPFRHGNSQVLSQLSALERTRRLQREIARGRVAAARRAATEWQARVEGNASLQADGVAAALKRQQVGIDPAAHRQVLAYLGRLAAEGERVRADHARAREQLAAAQSGLLHSDAQLNLVDKLRAAVLHRHAQEQSRRQAREADLAWTALQQVRRSRQRGGA